MAGILVVLQIDLKLVDLLSHVSYVLAAQRPQEPIF